ncbi:kynureninase, variant [Thecamonas trahens ATCC 50062]|uniref:Kynureninase n=1 Tax=Thecamonas trahens ATCC 50062 TaxID=461836 RepID=A0A0L0DH05_THETB|nr:kynureninase, variant [Thecamonas trahens ATCC 50062]KNC50588.1 kynureninase, variant [Thecamonas trahens ATCC 50062]|eukprot:XP_013762476.1 kynureninase, variant [Thecamonas trahens ATCC 50062]
MAMAVCRLSDSLVDELLQVAAEVGSSTVCDAKVAAALDKADGLSRFADAFAFPTLHLEGENACEDGRQAVYLCGNSLGLMPHKAREYVNEELEAWAKSGVRGHHEGKRAWLWINERVTDGAARLVGAKPIEVEVMNSLTMNLHVMMAPFYRPTATRYKIMYEAKAFPSDSYAFASQVRMAGFDPADALIAVAPRDGEYTLRTEDIEAAIAEAGDSLALVCFSGIQYYTGQLFDMPAITRAGHAVGAKVGFDLAHAVGNVELRLHDWGVDFAAWCHYKYCNSGPGAIAGAFIHEKYAHDAELHRMAGWWGHNKAERFLMEPEFVPDPGAAGFQVSNPPVLQTVAVEASLEIFDEATLPALRAKALRLTMFLELALESALGSDHVLSLQFTKPVEAVHAALEAAGVYCDVRKPDVMRIAPVPLYNSFSDVLRFVELLAAAVKSEADV